MHGKSLLSGIAIGVGLTLLLDPSRGGRRRATVRRELLRGARLAYGAADAAVTDAAHTVRGVVAATQSRFQADEVDDERLVARVRSRVGRVCSHPEALDIEVREGEVALRGAILTAEVSDVLTAAASVRGVHAVVNALEPHDTADGVPALQNGRPSGQAAKDLLQEHWAPATGALVGLALAAGGVAMAACARR